MSGTEASYLPWLAGAMGGVGGYLSGGGDTDSITGMKLQGDFNVPNMYQRYMEDMERVGAVGAQRAARDVSLPGAFVQSPPFIKGGVVDVGVTGRDPALSRPELLRRSGIDWGETPPFEGLEPGQEVFGTAEQVSPPQPMLGGGLQEVENALGLMGIKRDASGMLTFGANQFGPTTAQQSIRRIKRRDTPSIPPYSSIVTQEPTRAAGESDRGEEG
jgi:hypothetical protein